MKRRINGRKAVWELVCFVMAILGGVLFACNFTHTAPGFQTNIDTVVTVFISYGFFLGPAIIVCSIWAFYEVWSGNYPGRRRSRRTR